VVAPDPAPGPQPRLRVPSSLEQVRKLARYQLREYLRSRRFVALVVLVASIGAILTAVLAHFRTLLVTDDLAFYGSMWGGGANFVIILSAVFFGGDAIAGEFQNKTGYFLMGLPVRRATVYAGKFVAAFVAALSMLLLFLAILLGNGLYYFHASAFPWQLGVSLLLAIILLAAVLGATFLFSSLFKTSAYGFVLTAVLYLFGFTLLEGLIVGLVKIEPWMVISYASSTVGNVFAPTVNWGIRATVITTTLPGGSPISMTSYTPGIAEGVVIMLGYLVVTALGGLGLFEREEFA
jgi:ABC-2 type transport system permease protein